MRFKVTLTRSTVETATRFVEAADAKAAGEQVDKWLEENDPGEDDVDTDVHFGEWEVVSSEEEEDDSGTDEDEGPDA